MRYVMILLVVVSSCNQTTSPEPVTVNILDVQQPFSSQPWNLVRFGNLTQWISEYPTEPQFLWIPLAVSFDVLTSLQIYLYQTNNTSCLALAQVRSIETTGRSLPVSDYYDTQKLIQLNIPLDTNTAYYLEIISCPNEFTALRGVILK